MHSLVMADGIARISLFFLNCYVQEFIAGWRIRTWWWIARRELPKHIHTGEYLSEDGVFAIELWSCCIGNEELASARIRSGVDHCHQSRFAEFEIRIDLRHDVVARVTF